MAHILFADDDELIPHLFGASFRAAGHTVDWVSDGLDVIPALKGRNIDLLVLDCNMPGLGGTAVLRTIRADQRWALMPVIVLTGHASPADRAIADAARADEFCSKACAPDWLVFQAEELLMRKGRPAPVLSRTQSFGSRRLHAC